MKKKITLSFQIAILMLAAAICPAQPVVETAEAAPMTPLFNELLFPASYEEPVCSEQGAFTPLLSMPSPPSFTEECAECIIQCMQTTGYSSTNCRNWYCTPPC